MIVSPQNQRLKALRALISGRGQGQATRKAATLLVADLVRTEIAADASLLVLEGPNLIEAALDAGLPMPLVVSTERFLASDHLVLDRFATAPLAVEESLLDALADADSPRGLVAIVAAPEWTLASALEDGWSTLLYLDRLRDPRNVGAVLRVAEATGVDLVVLGPGTASWRHPRALRASAGSALRLTILDGIGSEELTHQIEAILGETPHWYGLQAGGRSVFDVPVASPRVLAVGSEAHGLSSEVAGRCTSSLAIPMEGDIESLNVATAAAVALFEIQRRSPLTYAIGGPALTTDRTSDRTDNR